VLVSDSVLKALVGLSTPSVANAIDALGVRPKVGFTMRPEIACQFIELPPVVGYAATVTIAAEYPPDPASAIHRHAYWDFLASLPKPLILVAQDLDEPSGLGAFLGEVNGTIHRGLGCIATITNGGYRDVDEMRALGLQVFAQYAITSAANMHIVEFGKPVRVGGITVTSGDLLHGDRHGVISVPAEAAQRIPEAAARIREKELEIVSLYASGKFTLDELKKLRPQ